MPSDVIDLRDFYQTGLGRVARRMIRRTIRGMWPDLHGMRLVGIGYATPFLSAISADTERELLEAAVQHAVAVHGHQDSPQLRHELAKMIKSQ